MKKPIQPASPSAETIFLRIVIIGMAALVSFFAIMLFPYLVMGASMFYSVPVAISTGIGLFGPIIPFFIVLWYGMRLLNLIDRGKTFTKAAVQALRVIKFGAIATSLLFAFMMPFFYTGAEEQDAPGVILIAAAFICLPFAVGIFAGLMQKLLQSAITIKKENDLTV
jgi:hypothetical protein